MAAPAKEKIQAPAWLFRLLTPLFARHIARELSAQHPGRLWLPLAVLVASHLFSFFWNYLYRGEFRRARLAELMSKPYGRVVVLHLTIIVGGIGAMALGSPVWALLLLLAFKIGLDLKAHLKEHSASA